MKDGKNINRVVSDITEAILKYRTHGYVHMYLDVTHDNEPLCLSTNDVLLRAGIVLRLYSEVTCLETFHVYTHANSSIIPIGDAVMTFVEENEIGFSFNVNDDCDFVEPGRDKSLSNLALDIYDIMVANTGPIKVMADLSELIKYKPVAIIKANVVFNNRLYCCVYNHDVLVYAIPWRFYPNAIDAEIMCKIGESCGANSNFDGARYDIDITSCLLSYRRAEGVKNKITNKSPDKSWLGVLMAMGGASMGVANDNDPEQYILDVISENATMLTVRLFIKDAVSNFNILCHELKIVSKVLHLDDLICEYLSSGIDDEHHAINVRHRIGYGLFNVDNTNNNIRWLYFQLLYFIICLESSNPFKVFSLLENIKVYNTCEINSIEIIIGSEKLYIRFNNNTTGLLLERDICLCAGKETILNPKRWADMCEVFSEDSENSINIKFE